ncbi:MAG: GNAT family N-acetyltransferase [Christensenellales bacterium]
MSTVEIREVATKKEFRLFCNFPIQLYKDHPYAVPDLRMDERNNLRRDRNPAFDYCEAKYFLAYRDGKVVGRIAGLINHAANEKWNTHTLRFCRVDFIDDEEVSKALFDAVEGWAKERGYDKVIGPIGFCDLDKEGMLVEGFDELDLFITIYNYPYYMKHLEKLGYAKEEDWIEYRIKVPQTIDPRLARLHQRVLERLNLHVAEIRNKREVKQYLTGVFDIINEAYDDLYGTVPLTHKQIDWYVGQFLPLINLKLLSLVLDENKRIVGLGLAAPSLSEPLRKHKGRLFPFGWISVLRACRKMDTMNLFFIAVRKEYINKGLPAVMMSHMNQGAIDLGVQYAETGPELETNHKVLSLWKSFDARQHRRRRCYAKQL